MTELPRTEVHRRTTFTPWVEHFTRNVDVHRSIEREIDWGAPCALDPTTRRAFVRSFQRFELGENGDGARLLAKAESAGDLVYLDALRRLVTEEQKHSALFRRGLEHMGAQPVASHWSDAAFTTLRRMLGLRTELALFLVAETVAMGYFSALASAAPDDVLRGIGRRIETDERDHVRFQVDRLRLGFATTPAPVRAVVLASWTIVALGAATVLVTDHAGALRACGLRPARAWVDSLASFTRAARSVLRDPTAAPLGPTTAPGATA
jgi:hypothetical protein